MNSNVIGFFQIERQIFGICPDCGQFFRLSDCKISLKRKKTTDWLDKLLKSEERVLMAQQELEDMAETLREKARELGRKQAAKIVKKIDPVCTPLGLNPDDAKVLFHPIDYIIFDGMKDGPTIRKIMLLDRQRRDADSRKLQRSIERAIESGSYEWQTVIINDSGKIICK